MYLTVNKTPVCRHFLSREETVLAEIHSPVVGVMCSPGPAQLYYVLSALHAVFPKSAVEVVKGSCPQYDENLRAKYEE